MAEKKKRKKSNPKVEFVSIKYTCENLEEVQEITKDQLNFSGVDDLCETCGSHGYVTVDFRCKCGKYHSIKLESW
jgi:hypothetical protein